MAMVSTEFVPQFHAFGFYTLVALQVASIVIPALTIVLVVMAHTAQERSHTLTVGLVPSLVVWAFMLLLTGALYGEAAATQLLLLLVTTFAVLAVVAYLLIGFDPQTASQPIRRYKVYVNNRWW